MKKNPSLSWRLYCLIDKSVKKTALYKNKALALYQNGVDVLQIRFKNTPSYKLIDIAKKIGKLAKKYKKALVVNDRIDVALASGANGVHLGAGDFSPEKARFFLGKKGIIGRSLHSTKEARLLRRKNINYVSAGPIFKTSVKRSLGAKGPEFIKQIKHIVSVPLFAIGGINKTNIRSVIESGAQGVAVCRASREARYLVKELR